MNVKKCNCCGKILDRKIDTYITFGEVEFNNPKSINIRWRSDEEHNEPIHESFVDWTDIDFCLDCWINNKKIICERLFDWLNLDI